jgi:hypothetical protein
MQRVVFVLGVCGGDGPRFKSFNICMRAGRGRPDDFWKFIGPAQKAKGNQQMTNALVPGQLRNPLMVFALITNMPRPVNYGGKPAKGREKKFSFLHHKEIA